MVAGERMMVVQRPYTQRGQFEYPADCPRQVPWRLIEPHRKWFMKNHDQTPERLHERGGLCPMELWMVVHHKEWSFDGAGGSQYVTREQAYGWLKEFVKE